jgi:hypothetical protein
MRLLKAIASRNKREGYYAGYYPDTKGNINKSGHRRWPDFEMREFYPRTRPPGLGSYVGFSGNIVLSQGKEK